MSLTADGIAKMLDKAEMRPEAKETYKNFTIFIGDGFTNKPHVHFQKFGVNKDAYPMGAFGTIWLIGKDDKIVGGALQTHEPGHSFWLGEDEKKKWRVQEAMRVAKKHIDDAERIRREERINA